MAPRQGGLQGQPPGPEGPREGRRVIVLANAPVDIPALKAQHSLGAVVEESGVGLRGRGRVRQGICPFHEESEGSFTVYGDTERYYCFGCGAGGDVLDFVQRTEGLSLPEAIRRLDGTPHPANPSVTERPRRSPGSTPGNSFVIPRSGDTLRPGASFRPMPFGLASATRQVAGFAATSSLQGSERRACGTRACSLAGTPNGLPA